METTRTELHEVINSGDASAMEDHGTAAKERPSPTKKSVPAQGFKKLVKLFGGSRKALESLRQLSL